MESEPLYCIIRNNKIIYNGKIIFEHSAIPLDDFLSEAYSKLVIAYPRFYKMDRLSQLGFLASEVLLRALPNKLDASSAVVLSNANSSLDTDLRYWESVKVQPSPSLFVCTLPNIVIGEICIRHGIKGENIFFVSPTFDPSWISGYVDMILTKGNTSRCLAGWVEVIGQHADVFLYLTDNTMASEKRPDGSKLLALYNAWNN
jgi:hypothetical protein